MAHRVHSDLQKELDRAGDAPVQAIIQIRPQGDPKSTPSPQQTMDLAESVLNRVAKHVGCGPHRTNVLRNIATMVVEATPAFIRSLMEQPEVISATPNQRTESPFIPPKGKRPVQ